MSDPIDGSSRLIWLNLRVLRRSALVVEEPRKEGVRRGARLRLRVRTHIDSFDVLRGLASKPVRLRKVILIDTARAVVVRKRSSALARRGSA